MHTYESVYQGAYEPVYVTTSVELMERVPGRTSSHIVKPGDLVGALARVASRSSMTDALSENPDRGRA